MLGMAFAFGLAAPARRLLESLLGEKRKQNMKEPHRCEVR